MNLTTDCNDHTWDLWAASRGARTKRVIESFQVAASRVKVRLEADQFVHRLILNKPCFPALNTGDADL